MGDFERRLHEIAKENEAQQRAEAKLDAEDKRRTAKVAAELEKRAKRLESIAQKRVFPLLEKFQKIVLKDKGSLTLESETGGYLPSLRSEDENRDLEKGPIAEVHLGWNYVLHYVYGEDQSYYDNAICVSVYEGVGGVNFWIRGGDEPTILANPNDRELERVILEHLELANSA